MMDNMFSGNEQKQVPKTLADCVKQDKVINNLWLWAQRLEKWRIFICIALGICGLLDAIDAAEVGDGFTDFIKVFLEYAVAAWLGIYCGFHACALLLGALAMIAQNSKITADVALLNSQQDGSIVEQEPEEIAKKSATPASEPVRESAPKTYSKDVLSQVRSAGNAARASNDFNIPLKTRGILFLRAGTEPRPYAQPCCGTVGADIIRPQSTMPASAYATPSVSLRSPAPSKREPM